MMRLDETRDSSQQASEYSSPQTMPQTSPEVEFRCVLPELDSSTLTNSSYDRSGRDLLTRLLEPNPQQRLRSLYSLERIAFYKDYHLNDVKRKKVSQ